MPQKTLRGKRHIRARAIVGVVREKKRQRKLDRDILFLSHVIACLPFAIENMVINVNSMFQSVRDAIGSFAVAIGNNKALELYEAGDLLGAQKEILKDIASLEDN